MRKPIFALALLATLVAGPALAEVQLKEDANYKVVNLARSEQPKVVEFFSYGCPHCFDFEPHVAAWISTKPAEIEVLRVPVTFGRAAWGFYAQAYYLAEALKVLDKTHTALFDRIHKEGKEFASEDDMLAFFEAQGIPAETAKKTLKSFSVQSKLKQAEHLAKKFQILSVPAFVVNDQAQVLMKGPETPEGFGLDNLGEGLSALALKK